MAGLGTDPAFGMKGEKMAPRKTTVPAKAEEGLNAPITPSERNIVPKEIDPSTIVFVKNGFQGKLIYISQRTGERFAWEGFGDEQSMELRELRNAKGYAKKFFENNWFMFDEDNSWVIPYLGLQNYYKNALTIEEFDEIFKLSPSKVKETIGKLSKGQKRSVAYRARQLVIDKEIDSLKMISALEEALGIELVEK